MVLLPFIGLLRSPRDHVHGNFLRLRVMRLRGAGSLNRFTVLARGAIELQGTAAENTNAFLACTAARAQP